MTMAFSFSGFGSIVSGASIQLRIALVSVVFVLGLVLIGISSWTGGGRLTAAFEDHKTYSTLASRSREVRAASFALKAGSRDVRFRQEATDLKDFGTGLASLKQAVATLAATPGAERFRDRIGAVEAPLKGIETDFALIEKMQIALRGAAPEGLSARLEDAADALAT
jgi:methyl-accepting chemotaxis protein